jgi:hypothetical protein
MGMEAKETRREGDKEQRLGAPPLRRLPASERHKITPCRPAGIPQRPRAGGKLTEELDQAPNRPPPTGPVPVGAMTDRLCRLRSTRQTSPEEVALKYLNNLAYAHDMQRLFQFGYFAGTIGPYDMDAVRRSLQPERVARSTGTGPVEAGPL